MIRRLAITIAVLSAVLPAAWANASDASKLLLAGGDSAVWLVRADSDGNSFDVAIREKGGSWKWIGQKLSGRPVQAVAGVRQLHVILHPYQHLVFRPSGDVMPAQNPRDPRWPAGTIPLAMGQWQDPNSGHLFGIVAVVPRPVGGPASEPTTASAPAATATRPASAPATTSTAPATTGPASSMPSIQSRPAGDGFRGRRKVKLGVFRRLDSTWVHLGDLPEMEIGEATAMETTTVMGRVYVLIADPGRGPNHLWEVSDGKSRPISISTAAVADDAPLAVETISKRLVVALSGPADPNGHRGVSLAEMDANSADFTVRKVLIGQQPFTLPVGSLPMVTRMDDQLAMLWQEPNGLVLGMCDVHLGQLSPESGTVDVFDHEPEGKEAIELLANFTWIVVIIVFAATILLRPRGPVEPFVLPAGTRPGSILKRVIALAIDLAPCLFVVGAIFSSVVGEQRVRELYEQASRAVQADKPGNMPLETAIMAIALLTVFVLYCTITEARFGATPGKKLMRLRVVGTAGMPATLRQCLIRNLMKIVELSLIATLIMFIVITMVVVITRYNQRLGDLLARTAVVDAATLPAHPGEALPPMPPIPPEMQTPPEEHEDPDHKDAEEPKSEQDKEQDKPKED